jgi:mRNA-degrading endonuclease RelE of RelBE toxin-antitoxin system
VSEESAPERIAVIWSPEARAGDVKKLRPPLSGFRLRCGDYRVFFDLEGESRIEVIGVRNRREAYR